MYDEKTENIVNTILLYLQSIDFDTKILAFANIESYPDRLSSGISFCHVAETSKDDTRYVILLFPTFEKNMAFIHKTFERLLSQNSPRTELIHKAMSKDEIYLFIFVFMHEIGHIQDHIDRGGDDKVFFDPLFGYNSNYNNNLVFEKYADQYAKEHLDKIYSQLTDEK